MDGGRLKWVEEGRELTREKPSITATSYTAPERDDSQIRAFRDGVLQHTQSDGQLVDVRSPAEFSGEKLHMEGYPQEGAVRGGHIPGADNVPWSRAANEDGTFKTADELRAIYQEEIGLEPASPTIAYCRIGERSSPHLVRVDESVGLCRCAELRWFVDGMGQQRRPSHRKIAEIARVPWGGAYRFPWACF